MTPKTRVLLAVEPHLYRDALSHVLRQEPSFKIVGSVDRIDEPVDLLAAVRRTRANAVVLAVGDCEAVDPLWTHLFIEFPDLLLVAVDPRRNRACTYHQAIVKRRMPDVGAEELVAELCRASATPGRVAPVGATALFPSYL